MNIFANFRRTARHTAAGGDYGPNPEGRMGATRRIAGLLCGRWSKWLVLGFWLVVFVVAGPLAGKLNSAQKNDASSWLPKEDVLSSVELRWRPR